MNLNPKWTASIPWRRLSKPRSSAATDHPPGEHATPLLARPTTVARLKPAKQARYQSFLIRRIDDE